MGGVGGGIREDSPYPDYAAGQLTNPLTIRLANPSQLLSQP
jgi:hypothetical protein